MYNNQESNNNMKQNTNNLEHVHKKTSLHIHVTD